MDNMKSMKMSLDLENNMASSGGRSEGTSATSTLQSFKENMQDQGNANSNSTPSLHSSPNRIINGNSSHNPSSSPRKPIAIQDLMEKAPSASTANSTDGTRSYNSTPIVVTTTTTTGSTNRSVSNSVNTGTGTATITDTVKSSGTGTGTPTTNTTAAALRKNPRDSASPRRRQKRTTHTSSSSKKNQRAYKEYDVPIVVVGGTSTVLSSNALDSGTCDANSLSDANSNSWSVGVKSTHTGASSSRNSAIGGLAYVETPSVNNTTNRSPFDFKGQNNAKDAAVSIGGGGSVGSRSTTTGVTSRNSTVARSLSKPTSTTVTSNHQPLREEQKLFEQRLCHHQDGIAVRKIHSNGKSQLRYVKCILIKNNQKGKRSSGKNRKNMSQSVDVLSNRPKNNISSGRSVSSLRGRIGRGGTKISSKASASAASACSSKSHNENGSQSTNHQSKSTDERYIKALAWGNKKKVAIPLNKFIAIKKGKTTDRTKRNAGPPAKLLSLITSDKRNGSLDIEAPTKLDRDKFAKAFSVFLNIPMDEDLVGESVNVEQARKRTASVTSSSKISASVSAASGGDDLCSVQSSLASSVATPQSMIVSEGDFKFGGGLLPSMTPSPGSSKEDIKLLLDGSNHEPLDKVETNESALDKNHGTGIAAESHASSNAGGSDNLLLRNPNKNIEERGEEFKAVDMRAMEEKESSDKDRNKEEDESKSDVSSLTHGFDQEIIEELHQALNELRAELDASRAEAARAVKVAEQAIQSAESCSSNDWNSTVTHKAAEAAAQAQKRSAEAIAKQRVAEEKLASERKSASFWRKQAVDAEEEVGKLQTKYAGAEIQRVALLEEVEREKQKAATYIQALKHDISEKECIQRDTLVSVSEQNRLLEIELDGTRRDLEVKAEETKALHDSITEIKSGGNEVSRSATKKKFFGGRSKKSRGQLLLDSETRSTSTSGDDFIDSFSGKDRLKSDELLKLQAEATATRKQFQILRRTTIDELNQLPEEAMKWTNIAAKAVQASQSELASLKNRLSMETAHRRRLLNEVQNLKGTVRVYCCPKPPTIQSATKNGILENSIISIPSNDIAVLHRERVIDMNDGTKNIEGPMSFEFDRTFAPNVSQNEIYSEMEDLVLGSLEGYNSCIMAYGQSGTGKTRSIIGDFEFNDDDSGATPQLHLATSGAHLIAADQLFKIAESANKKHQEVTFSLSILEICNEKLIDMVGESIGMHDGRDWTTNKFEENLDQDKSSDSKSKKKLEICTNLDGDTIVQGLQLIPVKNISEVIQIWKDAIVTRTQRLKSQGFHDGSREQSSHVIATLEVITKNITTGSGNIGRIQFVDLAGSDVVPRRTSSRTKSRATSRDDVLAPVGNGNEWKFSNKSISHLLDVVNARYQFSRSVSFRNSTLTHLLRDNLTADAKVLLLVCVSSDSKDLQDTANSLRFASKMRKVVIGRATKHSI